MSNLNYHIYASASPRGDTSFMRQISDANETDDKSYLFSDAKILIEIVLKEGISIKEKISKISNTLCGELIQKLEEMLVEFNEMSEKICLVIKSSDKVSEHIISLTSTLQDIIKYFQKLKIKNITIFNKKKYKLIMLNLIQELRSYSTKLISDVTLDLLLHKSNSEGMNPNNKNVIDKEKSEDINYAYAFFYGIYGQVQNFNIAFTLFSKAVKNNSSDTDSMLRLSECYEYGYGVDKNISNSQYWLQKAVNKGNNAIAKNKLAMMILDKYGQKNINVLKRILKNKITNNNGVSEMTLNNTFDYGDISINNTITDIDKDIESNDKEIEYAMKLLLEASQEGIAISQTNLGIIYEFINDFDQAAKWYSVAALDGGCNLATNKLGKLYLLGHGVEKNPVKAFSMFKIAAKSGNNDSHYNIGKCLESGIGTNQNFNEAIYHYKLAAENGNCSAQFNLGYLLSQIAIDIKNGIRNAEDFKDFIESYEDPNAQITKYESYYDFIIREGMKWLQKSSENGNSSASYHLAQIYEHGFFKKPDMESALEKYKFASNQGHQKSSLYAGNMYYRGVGCVADSSIACKYYLQSALSGNKDAMNAIGILYEEAESGEYFHEAASWFLEACKFGLEVAFINLSLLLQSGKLESNFISRDGLEFTIKKAKLWLVEQSHNCNIKIRKDIINILHHEEIKVSHNSLKELISINRDLVSSSTEIDDEEVSMISQPIESISFSSDVKPIKSERIKAKDNISKAPPILPKLNI